MLEALENIDKEIFLLINGWHGEFADLFMHFASEKWVWIPFYAVIIYFLFRKYGLKVFYVILPVAFVIVATDQFSVLIKNEVARYRPCHNLDLIQAIHIVKNHCGGKFGFVSSHSANAFGLFAYLGFILNSHFKNLKILLFIWACLLAYSRIYLGVHYPADVIGGAILGIILSFIIVKIVKMVYNNFSLSYD